MRNVHGLEMCARHGLELAQLHLIIFYLTVPRRAVADKCSSANVNGRWDDEALWCGRAEPEPEGVVGTDCPLDWSPGREEDVPAINRWRRLLRRGWRPSASILCWIFKLSNSLLASLNSHLNISTSFFLPVHTVAIRTVIGIMWFFGAFSRTRCHTIADV